MQNYKDKEYNRYNRRKKDNKKKKENNYSQMRRYKKKIKYSGRGIRNKNVNK